MFITLEGIEGSGKTTALAHLVAHLERGGHVCRVTRDPTGRDELTVLAEAHHPGADMAAAAQALLKARMGVDMRVELVPPGATAELTQIEKRQKPIRLIDERGA